MKLVANGSASAQDLAGGFVAVATLSPPATGCALYRLVLKLTGLHADHDLCVQEAQAGSSWTYEGAGCSGGADDVVELETPVDAAEAAVLVRVRDAAGLSTSAAFSWRCYQVDLVSAAVAVSEPPVVVTPPSSPLQTTAYVVTRDEAGVPLPSQQCQFRLIRPPAGAGNSYELSAFSATSNGSGLLQVALLRGATYEGRRGTGDWVRFHTPAGAVTYALPILLGEPDS